MKTLAEIKSILEPIKSQEQYNEYLTIIDSLVDCEESSPEEEILELVTILVDDYELKSEVFS